jgi:hypothetical protein
MKRLSRAIGILSTAALLTAGLASAASLGISSGGVSAGNTPVRGCSASALTATRNVDNNGNVTQVNVIGVPQACAGETLAVTLEDNAHANLGTSTTTVGACVGGCTVSLTGFGTIAASSLVSYALSLTQ